MQILSILLSLVIYGFLFYVLWWGLEKINPSEPFKQGAVVVLVIATVVVIFGLFMGFIPPFPFLKFK